MLLDSHLSFPGMDHHSLIDYLQKSKREEINFLLYLPGSSIEAEVEAFIFDDINLKTILSRASKKAKNGNFLPAIHYYRRAIDIINQYHSQIHYTHCFYFLQAYKMYTKYRCFDEASKTYKLALEQDHLIELHPKLEYRKHLTSITAYLNSPLLRNRVSEEQILGLIHNKLLSGNIKFDKAEKMLFAHDFDLRQCAFKAFQDEDSSYFLYRASISQSSANSLESEEAIWKRIMMLYSNYHAIYHRFSGSIYAEIILCILNTGDGFNNQILKHYIIAGLNLDPRNTTLLGVLAMLNIHQYGESSLEFKSFLKEWRNNAGYDNHLCQKLCTETH